MHLRILLLFVAEDAVLIPAIIMVGEFAATRFMEIFGPTIGWLRWRLLFPPPGEQPRIRLVFLRIHKGGFNQKV